MINYYRKRRLSKEIVKQLKSSNYEYRREAGNKFDAQRRLSSLNVLNLRDIYSRLQKEKEDSKLLKI